MKKNLISVIIPSYNHARYIDQAIRSVFEQNYPQIEIIVIDDGSSDGTISQIEKTIEALPATSGRKIIFEKQRNSGAHNAINKGLQISTGDFLTILNSDDYFLPNRLSALRHSLANGRSEFAFSRVRHVDEDGSRMPDSHPARKWYIEAIKTKNVPSTGFLFLINNIAVTTGNFFFSRKLFERIGGFNNFILMHDYDFLLRMLFHTEPVFVNRELIAYRIHGSNTFSRFSTLEEEEGLRLSREFCLNSIVIDRPRNRKAPCPKYWKDKYTEFFETHPSRVASWLGGSKGIADIFSS